MNIYFLFSLIYLGDGKSHYIAPGWPKLMAILLLQPPKCTITCDLENAPVLKFSFILIPQPRFVNLRHKA